MSKRIALEVVTSCEGCGGACCEGQAGLPVVWYLGAYPLGDFDALPADIKANLKAHLETFRREGFLSDNEPCVWLDRATGKCANYAYRPGVCRDFKVGSDSCIRRRAEAGKAPKYRMVKGRLVRTP